MTENMSLQQQGAVHNHQARKNGVPYDMADPRNGNEAIYQQSTITLNDSRALVDGLVRKHHLPENVITDVLHVIKCHLPPGTFFPTTRRHFRNACSKLSEIIENTIRYYCRHCKQLYETSCNCEVTRVRQRSMFVTLDVKEQINRVMLRNSQYLDFQERGTNDLNDTRITDINDGKIMDKLASVKEKYLTTTFNTDGIEVFNSSNYTVWPIFLVINDLPYHIRSRPENMILCCLWGGYQKPAFDLFLKPFAQSMFKLAHEGMLMDLNHNNKNELFRIFVTAAVCDLPAKAECLNCQYHSGYYACMKCEQPGTHHSSRHQYPFDPDNPRGPKRDHRGIMLNAKEATRSNNPHTKGIKGNTWMGILPNFDLVRGFSIDYMHGVLLGVTKGLLTKFWLGNCHHPSYIKRRMETLNKRIADIQPPSRMPRLPRGLDDIKQWKAHEYRSWLLYFGIPVLQGILSEPFLSHFSCLSNGIYTLLQDKISSEEIRLAETKLTSFVKDYATLYGEDHVNLNVHGLLHYGDVVRDLGPLWAHSCFSFENANGALLKNVHAISHIDKQILRGVQSFHRSPDNRFRDSPEARTVYEVLTKNASYGDRIRQQMITDAIYAVTDADHQNHCIPENHTDMIKRHFHVNDLSSVQVYTRIVLNKRDVIDAMSRKSNSKRESSGVLVYDPSKDEDIWGKVEYFFHLQGRHFALLHCYVVESILGNIQVKLAVGPSHHRIVETQNIRKQLICVEVDSRMYLSPFVNSKEVE